MQDNPMNTLTALNPHYITDYKIQGAKGKKEKYKVRLLKCKKQLKKLILHKTTLLLLQCVLMLLCNTIQLLLYEQISHTFVRKVVNGV